MYIERGKGENDKNTAFSDYANAMSIIDLAKENLNDSEYEIFDELESKIWNEIGNVRRVKDIQERIWEKYRSVKGFYISANWYYKEALKKGGDQENTFLSYALTQVDGGLSLLQDEDCLKLKAKIIGEQTPFDVKKYYEALSKWKNVMSSPSTTLLFEYGRVCFLLGYYKSSDDTFKLLADGVGISHAKRSTLRCPYLDDKNNTKEFEGTVVSINGSYSGRLRCDTLRDLRDNLHFRPIACNFSPNIGDNVKFYIKFNFRGPMAVDVRKL